MISERGRNLTQQELEIATIVFNDANLLGRGNFESVYKACIDDSISCVAVKCWLYSSKYASDWLVNMERVLKYNLEEIDDVQGREPTKASTDLFGRRRAAAYLERNGI
ncbi:hypothetical protein OIU85_005049 [Salix viminalis]|uniref:Uncharacterized protein n=1 Tax=Salix viminalis TaxID=40686 RepID=A0A9Q0PUJ9_SALVM|nr:hypothetical protein OIU85_005049 [Salix viminalis]